MTSINDLFDWILEEIFIKLTRNDRLVCKEVNKRWYNILMNRKIFREDRHIYIKTTELDAGEDPMDVLMQAQNPYQIYTICDIIESENTRNNDLIQFFEYVGLFIEELTYKGKGNYFDIFTAIPALKSLKLPEINLFDIELQISAMQQPSLIFRHLKIIQIERIGIFSYAKTSINVIKEFIPQNCDIILTYAHVKNNYQVQKLCELMTTVKKVNSICIDREFEPKAEVKNYLESNILNCDVVIMNCPVKHGKDGAVDELQNDLHELLTGVIW